jgi:hypothetical protein
MSQRGLGLLNLLDQVFHHFEGRGLRDPLCKDVLEVLLGQLVSDIASTRGGLHEVSHLKFQKLIY